MSDRNSAILTKSTLVPLGAAAALATCIVSAAVWINTALLRVDYRLESVERGIAAMEQRGRDAWMVRDMEHWAELLKRGNPEIDVPDVR